MTAALARIAPASAELAVGLSRSRFNRPVLRRITIEIPGLLSQADMRPHAAKAGMEDWIKPRSAMAAARRVAPDIASMTRKITEKPAVNAAPKRLCQELSSHRPAPAPRAR